MGTEIARPVFILGVSRILESKKLAFFCAVKCPGEPIVRAYDFARGLWDTGFTVIGGF